MWLFTVNSWIYIELNPHCGTQWQNNTLVSGLQQCTKHKVSGLKCYRDTSPFTKKSTSLLWPFHAYALLCTLWARQSLNHWERESRKESLSHFYMGSKVWNGEVCTCGVWVRNAERQHLFLYYLKRASCHRSNMFLCFDQTDFLIVLPEISRLQHHNFFSSKVLMPCTLF